MNPEAITVASRRGLVQLLRKEAAGTQASAGSSPEPTMAERRLQAAATQKPPGLPCLAGATHIISLLMQRGTPDPKSEPQPQRAGPPHNPGLRKLIEAKQKWHRPERTLPLP